jgi:hypothetical protein
MNEKILEYWKNGRIEHWEKPRRKMDEPQLFLG